MALVAGNSRQLVLRAVKEALILRSAVANQAALSVRLRLAVEAIDELLRFRGFRRVARRGDNRIDVILAWAVTSFTTHARGLLFRMGLGVNRFGELRELLLMTSGARFHAYIVSRLSALVALPDS